jgi:hypothetical protein
MYSMLKAVTQGKSTYIRNASEKLEVAYETMARLKNEWVPQTELINTISLEVIKDVKKLAELNHQQKA